MVSPGERTVGVGELIEFAFESPRERCSAVSETPVTFNDAATARNPGWAIRHAPACPR
jgi:hypothetical protein